MSSGPGFLALAPHRSGTASLLSDAARRRGMEVTVLPADGVPERYREREDGHYYGGPRFAARVADPLGVALLEPHDGWLDGLPDAFTGRSVSRVRLSEARRRTGPLFVKPPTDKSFPAAVWAVVEANMAWFSTVYAADPDRALDVVLRSAGPGSLVRERDLTFRRARPAEPASRG
ncbi:ATP-grasp domain-containing protein [Streptomyces anulatus]|uniref:hypothetical protein n=1 Tax=Streptomyces anulatus TaxID=1892 RepID=UPI0036620272